MSKPRYVDLGDEQEDARIEAIGRSAMQGGSIAFITDDEPGKADRYVAKLKAKFPQIIEVGRFNGPAPQTVTVKVRKES